MKRYVVAIAMLCVTLAMLCYVQQAQAADLSSEMARPLLSVLGLILLVAIGAVGGSLLARSSEVRTFSLSVAGLAISVAMIILLLS